MKLSHLFSVCICSLLMPAGAVVDADADLEATSFSSAASRQARRRAEPILIEGVYTSPEDKVFGETQGGAFSGTANLEELFEKYPRLTKLVEFDTARFQKLLRSGEDFVTAMGGGSYSYPNGFTSPSKKKGKGGKDDQLVFLDFTPQVATYEVEVFNGTLTTNSFCGLANVPRRVFTKQEQYEIKRRLERDYKPFDFKFTTDRVSTHPFEKEFTTLRFFYEQPFFDLPTGLYQVVLGGDCPPVVDSNTFAVDPNAIDQEDIVDFFSATLGGVAENIDFLNTNKAELAVLDGTDFLDFVINFVGDVDFVESNIQVPRYSYESVDDYFQRVAINGAANIGAHELGHISGLRHHDSLGPIGQNITAENYNHIMATPLFYGDSAVLGVAYGDDSFFSERSALKLTAALESDIISEHELKHINYKRYEDGLEAMELDHIKVPDTLLSGINSGGKGDFSMQAMAFYGTLLEFGDVGTYRFYLEAEKYLNLEVISFVDSKFYDFIDSVVTLFVVEDNGTLTELTSNNDDPEDAKDSFLNDFLLPFNATYEIQVSAFPYTAAGAPPVFQEFETGDYAGFISTSTLPLERAKKGDKSKPKGKGGKGKNNISRRLAQDNEKNMSNKRRNSPLRGR